MLHLRPRNRFEDLESVYLVGGGTHPGSGLPSFLNPLASPPGSWSKTWDCPAAAGRPERSRIGLSPIRRRRSDETHEPLGSASSAVGWGAWPPHALSPPAGIAWSCSNEIHWLGGKAAVLEEQGYRFDKGPTILTMPSVLRRIFAEAGQRMEEHLDLIRLDPQWRCFFADGSVLDLRQDGETMADSLARFLAANRIGRRLPSLSRAVGPAQCDLGAILLLAPRRFAVGHRQFAEHVPAVAAAGAF